MDVYSRRIIGYSLSAEDMGVSHSYAALKMALQLRGVSHYGGNLIHHSDMGSQYASGAGERDDQESVSGAHGAQRRGHADQEGGVR